MKRRVDLIDQFADLVVGADDPRRLAERTLEVVMSLNNGRSGAVFSCSDDRVALFASRGIDQAVLDAVETVWSRSRDSLRKGETFYVPDRTVERRLPPENGDQSGAASFAVVPVFEAETLVALLYVDSHDPHFCASHDLERLTKFSRIVAKAVTDNVPVGTSGTSPAWRASWVSPVARSTCGCSATTSRASGCPRPGCVPPPSKPVPPGVLTLPPTPGGRRIPAA